MSKAGKRNLLIALSAAFLVALFVVVAFLTLPIGAHAGILPLLALYIVGGVAATGALAASVIFFLLIRKGG